MVVGTKQLQPRRSNVVVPAAKPYQPELKTLSWRELASKRFHKFCSHTTLHGWSYLAAGSDDGPSNLRAALWWTVLLALYTAAGLLVINNTQAFLDSTIQTTITSRSASLKDVYFPSVTVCNINQFETSFMEGLGMDLSCLLCLK